MNASSGNVVDSKIVEMQFQNQNFESNAKESISTLDRLKKALNFSAKDIGTFDTISKGVETATGHTQGLTNAFGSLNNALGSIRNVAVFSMIADEAIKAKNAVESFIKSVTVVPVTQGWDKYAQKTQAVQTVMASTADQFTDTATQMEYVNEQLGKLNWFTDETSYNFLDMVNNIGKFTANQIKLDDAVTAMEGISTWAAVSGAGINEAGRAMYNLAQAIGVGSVKLIDWKSIENANMGTAEFKKTVIETAEAMGTLTKAEEGLWKTTDGSEVSVRNFNENLKDGWFTSEVLVETLKKYGGFTDKLHEYLEEMSDEMYASKMLGYIEDFEKGTLDWDEAVESTGLTAARLTEILDDLSSEEMEFGRKAFVAAQQAVTFQQAIEATQDAASTAWMNTFEILFGDFEQARHLWTDLSENLYDVFVGGVNERNELLKEAFKKTETLTSDDWDKVKESGVLNPAFMAAIKKAAEEHGLVIDKMESDEEAIGRALDKGILSIGDVKEAYDTLLHGGPSQVNEDLLEQVKGLQESDEAFQTLLDTVSKYSDQDVTSIVFGDGQISEEAGDLERSIDGVIKALGLTQDDAEEVVNVLNELGIVSGTVGEKYADMTDEQLKTLGWSDEQITKFREMSEAGKETADILKEIGVDPTSGGDHWLQGLYNIMDSVIGLVEVFKEVWEDMFPSTDADTVYQALKTFDETTGGLVEWIEGSDTLRGAFRAVASVVDIVVSNLSLLGKAAAIKGLMRIVTLAGGAVTKFVKLGGAVAIASAIFEALSGFLEGLGIDISDVISFVSNAINSFAKWTKESDILNKALGFIHDTARKVGKAVRTFINAFLKMPIISKNIDRFSAAFTSFKNQFLPYMSKIPERFQAFIDRVKALDGVSLDNIGSVFQAFKEEVLDYILNFPGFKQIIGTFKALGSDIGGELSKIGSVILEYFKGLKEKLDGTFAGKLLDFVIDSVKKVADVVSKYYGKLKESGFSLSGVLNFIIGVISDFAGFLFKLAKFIAPILLVALPILGVIKIVKKIASLFIGVKELFSSVNDAISSIASKNEAEALSHKAEAFKSIALAIGVIAVALYALSKTDQGKLWSSVGAIAVITALLAGMLILISKLTSSSKKTKGLLSGFKNIGEKINEYIDTLKIDKVAGALLKVAGSIGILALALKVISTIDGDKIWSSVGVMAALSAMLLGIMFLMSKIGKSKTGVGSMLGLFAITASIASLVSSMNKMQIDEHILSKLGIVELLLASVTAVSLLLSKFQPQGTVKGALTVAAMALAVNMLVDAINKIKIDESAWTKLLFVGVLLGSVTAVAMVLSEFKPEGTVRGALSVLAIAAAVNMLVKAVNEINIDENAWVKLGFVEVLLGSVTAVAMILSAFKPEGTIRGALSILAIAAAVDMLVDAIRKIKINKNSWTKLGFVEVLLGSVTAVAMILSAFKPEGTLKGALSLIVIAGTVRMLVNAMNAIKGGKNLLTKFAIIETLLLSMAGISILMSKFNVGGSLSSAVSMIALAGSIAILVNSLSSLAKADPENLNQAMKAIGVIALSMSLVAGVAGLLKPSIASMLGISAFVVVLGIVLTAMSELSGKKVERIATGLSKMMLSLAVFVASMAFLEMFKPSVSSILASLLGLVAVIGAVGLVIGLLSKFTDTQKTIEITSGLGDLLMDLSKALAIAALVGKLTNVGDVVEGVLGLAGVLGVFGVLSAAAGYLATKYPEVEDYINRGAPLLEKVGEVTGSVVSSIINGIGEGMFGDHTPIQMLADDIKYMAETLSSDEFKKNLEAISKVYSDSPLAGINQLSFLGTGFTFTVGGLFEGLASIVTELETNKTAIGMFVDDIAYIAATLGSDKFKEDIKGIGHIFEGAPLVGLNLLSFIGVGTFYSIAGFVSSIASILPEIQQGKTAVQSFVDDLSYIAEKLGSDDFKDDIYAIGHVFDKAPLAGFNLFGLLSTGVLYSVVGTIKSVGDFATKITGEDCTAVESVVNDIDYIAKTFGSTDFAGNMKNINDVFNEAPKAGLNLGWGLTVASLYGITGFVGSIADIPSKLVNDKGNVEKVCDDINEIATTMGSDKFSEAMTNISEIDTKATEMITELAKAAGKVSDIGVRNAINDQFAKYASTDGGENENQAVTAIKQFTNDINEIANALLIWKVKSALIGEITVDSESITNLVEAVDAISSDGGLFGAIDSFLHGTVTEQDYKDFGDRCGDLGTALQKFNENLGKDADIQKMATATDMLLKIGDISAYFDRIGSDNGVFDNFNARLPQIASTFNTMVDMIEDMQGLNTLGMAAAGISAALNTMTDEKLEGDLADEALVQRFVDNLKKLKEAIEDLNGLNTGGVDKLNEALNNLGTSDVSGASDKITRMEEDVTSKNLHVGTEANASLASGMSDTSAIEGASANVADAALSALEDTSQFSEKGTAMITAFTTALSEAVSSSGVGDIIQQMTSEAISALENGVSVASDYGGYFASGFANGIYMKAYLAREQAAAMATAAANAIKNALNINSPSKVTYEYGTFFGEGFGNAIEDYSDTAYKKASLIGTTALKALGDSLDVIDETFASDDIYEPIIRPVVDTSEIQNGASMIGEILSNSTPTNLVSNVKGINYSLDARKKATSLDDVVSALGLVEKSTSNMRGGDTYNVNGITYDDGTNVAAAVKTLVRAVRMDRRT